MPKIVLDPKESAIETFAKLFFSATRNMGLSDKEACEALRNSIEAAENAPAMEKYDWYGSPANIERILQREFNNEMHCDTILSKNIILKETNEYKNYACRSLKPCFGTIAKENASLGGIVAKGGEDCSQL